MFELQKNSWTYAKNIYIQVCVHQAAHFGAGLLWVRPLCHPILSPSAEPTGQGSVFECLAPPVLLQVSILEPKGVVMDLAEGLFFFVLQKQPKVNKKNQLKYLPWSICGLLSPSVYFN